MEIYRLSFTGASFFLHESLELAKIYIDKEDWKKAVDYLILENVNNRSTSTIKRESSELVLRLKSLPSQLLQRFISTDADDAKIILLYAILKSYPIIKSFCLDVLYEKSQMMDFEIQEYEINAFFRKQEELYDEFDKKSDATKYKLKQVIFKILSDATLIKSTKNKTIIKPLIETATAELILKDTDESYLKALLMDEHEIAMIKGLL
jgi:hypothetical protein